MYPLPNMDSILNKFSRAKFISKVDLKQAYFQILIDEESREYTALHRRAPKMVRDRVNKDQRRPINGELKEV